MKYLITAQISAFSIVTNRYAETTTKIRHYHCPAARTLTHHVFTYKGCMIIAREPRSHLGVIPKTFQTTLVQFMVGNKSFEYSLFFSGLKENKIISGKGT